MLKIRCSTSFYLYVTNPCKFTWTTLSSVFKHSFASRNELLTQRPQLSVRDLVSVITPFVWFLWHSLHDFFTKCFLYL